MLPEYFAAVGAVIASAGGFVYLYDTIRGRAKPNRVTWLLWGILPMITFLAQRAEGANALSWASFAAGFTPLLIVTASFLNKKAYWKTSSVDYICMTIAILGITLWFITKDAVLAILLTIVADFSAGLPTIIKTYVHPQTESWRAYALSTVGFAVSILAIHDWTIANYAFVVYLCAANGVMAAFSYTGRRKSIAQANS